eukprot:TRINITY_DN23057_c0_g1_i1.p1 TRINITY_DN23057_c0_g1~~TRINITY_DN23057_c0_g1_i1.p1  ORF type:complete len:368 (+),score=-14.87 TRINITY_DN23057_c0_g1_i1:117-1106(+)
MARPLSVPLFVAPAMDYTMWLNPATQRNLNIIESDGAVIIPPNDGELASGLSGPGRLPEFNQIIDKIRETLINRAEKTNNPETSSFTLQQAVEKDKFNAELELELLKQKTALASLKGKKILISAGPTKEKIDDVRYIINASTGKMGYALATAAANAGAQVFLVSGPTELPAPDGVKMFKVESASEMYDKCTTIFPECDAAIMSAAVADFTPEFPVSGKIKKRDLGGEMILRLIPTKDILGELGKIKKEKQKLIGFALESVNEIEYGKNKLYEKNCDLIVVNSAGKPNSGFGVDVNTITILDRDGAAFSYETMSKLDCAKKIIEKLANLF